jgi:hypothetical protein
VVLLPLGSLVVSTTFVVVSSKESRVRNANHHHRFSGFSCDGPWGFNFENLIRNLIDIVLKR